MPARFYMDVHIPWPITEQLRKRRVDVLTAQEDGNDRLPDPLLLERATELGRAMFTFDIGFKLLAEQWAIEGRHFGGLFYVRSSSISLGRCIAELQLIAEASEAEEWLNTVKVLPL